MPGCGAAIAGGVSLLSTIVQRVRSTPTAVVIFDLDSTLFDTGPRNLGLVRRWASQGPWAERAAAMTADEFGWDAAAPLVARGATPDEVGDFRTFWRAHFFTDDAVVLDAPAPGGAAFVREVHGLGAHVVYLTGRHVGGMEVGTVKALTQHGFPMWRPRVTVALKPNFHLDDKRFKAMTLPEIGGLGTVVATFDNEPGNCNAFQERWPEAVNVLFGSVCSPEAEDPDPSLIRLATFER